LASGCAALSKYFFRNHHWGVPVGISGGQSWATTALSGTKTVTLKLKKKAAVKLFDHTPITYLLQARNQGGEIRPRKFFAPLEKCVRHCSKNLGPSQKTLRPSWCPKLVTGLIYWVPTSLASCNLENGFRRFVPQIISNNNSAQPQKKRMLIVIHFIHLRSFFYRDLMLVA